MLRPATWDTGPFDNDTLADLSHTLDETALGERGQLVLAWRSASGFNPACGTTQNGITDDFAALYQRLSVSVFASAERPRNNSIALLR